MEHSHIVLMFGYKSRLFTPLLDNILIFLVNARLRDEFINEEIFTTLFEAKVLIEN
jgi:hypothetical protein